MNTYSFQTVYPKKDIFCEGEMNKKLCLYFGESSLHYNQNIFLCGVEEEWSGNDPSSIYPFTGESNFFYRHIPYKSESTLINLNMEREPLLSPHDALIEHPILMGKSCYVFFPLPGRRVPRGFF